MDKIFSDQVAIITGGSEGIGFGIANDLALKGAKVYLTARTEEKLKSAKNKIESVGGKAEIMVGDITDMNRMREIIDNVYRDNNRLDIFVNNAGEYISQSLQTPFEERLKLIDFLFRAPYEITDYLINKFHEKNELKILTILSQASIKVFESGLGYGPAKMALASALFHLEEELKKKEIKNIHLYRLYPNTVATEKAMPLIREGKLQNPVSLESVVDTAIAMLEGKTPTRDVRIGYYPGAGIIRHYLSSDPTGFYNPVMVGKEIVDADFKPEDLF